MNLWTDGAAAVAARDEALSRVEVHSVDWRVVAWDALMSVARAQEFVVSEDVWARLSEWGVSPPPDGRAMGPVMVRASKEGVLVTDGFGNSSKPEHHHDVQRRYRSTVWR